MRYTKPPLTYAEQAALLLERGLVADAQVLEERLAAVNYYRLSGYLYPFQNSDDTFQPGTTLDAVWHRYTFDRRLRLLIMDPIERVEISLRTQLVYEHAHVHGPFGYESPLTLPGLKLSEHTKFLSQLDQEKKRSQEEFVKHFEEKYGSHHARLPLWAAAEIMSLGGTVSLYRGAESTIQSKVAGQYGVAPAVLLSWVHALLAVRNICAHHGRLWNRVLGVRPKIPRARKHPEWHSPASISNERVFSVLTLLKHMMDRVAPQSRWPTRFKTFLAAEYPDIPREQMGFPPDWDRSPIWTK